MGATDTGQGFTDIGRYSKPNTGGYEAITLPLMVDKLVEHNIKDRLENSLPR
jgi:hypothetical protein